MSTATGANSTCRRAGKRDCHPVLLPQSSRSHSSSNGFAVGKALHRWTASYLLPYPLPCNPYLLASECGRRYFDSLPCCHKFYFSTTSDKVPRFLSCLRCVCACVYAVRRMMPWITTAVRTVWIPCTYSYRQVPRRDARDQQLDKRRAMTSSGDATLKGHAILSLDWRRLISSFFSRYRFILLFQSPTACFPACSTHSNTPLGPDATCLSAMASLH